MQSSDLAQSARSYQISVSAGVSATFEGLAGSSTGIILGNSSEMHLFRISATSGTIFTTIKPGSLVLTSNGGKTFTISANLPLDVNILMARGTLSIL